MQIEMTPTQSVPLHTFHPSLFVPRTARSRATNVASLSRRTVAYLIDGISVAATAIAVCIFASAWAGVTNGGLTPVIVAAIASVVAAFAYFPLLESRDGQTIGKHLMRIKVVAADGAPATPAQCWTRQAAWLVDGIGFVGLILEARSSRHQRLGDILADTVVVNA